MLWSSLPFWTVIKKGVRDSTADKHQCMSPAELCCHYQQNHKISHTQNWAKYLRMYKRGFLFHLSAFCFISSREGAVGMGQVWYLLLLSEKGWQNVVTPRTGTSAGGFQLQQLRPCEAELFGLCLADGLVTCAKQPPPWRRLCKVFCTAWMSPGPHVQSSNGSYLWILVNPWYTLTVKSIGYLKRNIILVLK